MYQNISKNRRKTRGKQIVNNKVKTCYILNSVYTDKINIILDEYEIDKISIKLKYKNKKII